MKTAPLHTRIGQSNSKKAQKGHLQARGCIFYTEAGNLSTQHKIIDCGPFLRVSRKNNPVSAKIAQFLLGKKKVLLEEIPMLMHTICSYDSYCIVPICKDVLKPYSLPSYYSSKHNRLREGGFEDADSPPYPSMTTIVAWRAGRGIMSAVMINTTAYRSVSPSDGSHHVPMCELGGFLGWHQCTGIPHRIPTLRPRAPEAKASSSHTGGYLRPEAETCGVAVDILSVGQPAKGQIDAAKIIHKTETSKCRLTIGPRPNRPIPGMKNGIQKACTRPVRPIFAQIQIIDNQQLAISGKRLPKPRAAGPSPVYRSPQNTLKTKHLGNNSTCLYYPRCAPKQPP